MQIVLDVWILDVGNAFQTRPHLLKIYIYIYIYIYTHIYICIQHHGPDLFWKHIDYRVILYSSNHSDIEFTVKKMACVLFGLVICFSIILNFTISFSSWCLQTPPHSTTSTLIPVYPGVVGRPPMVKQHQATLI